LFANIGKYEACGIFTKGHFILIAITIIGIFLALKQSCKKSKEEVHKRIKKIIIVMCILESLKIIYNIKQNSIYGVNTYIPLYYSGSAIGGIVFLIYPSTSLPMYPAFHIVSIYSFLFHGVMIYLGIVINKTKYIELKMGDVKYFASLIGVMCIIALLVNHIFNSNLMFISNNFPGNPIEILYRITNGGILYNLIMIITQMTIPFYISYYVIKKTRFFR